MQLQDDYFAAYRSLKLTRDASGVLVVEFHSKGGPFRFTAQDHTEFVDAFYRYTYIGYVFQKLNAFVVNLAPNARIGDVAEG